MSNVIKAEGFVQALFIKTGTNQRGPWAVHSVKLANADGSENPTFFNFGFKRPPFQADVVIQDRQKVAEGEGSYVRFEANQKDEKNAEYVEGSGQIVKNAPARTKKAYKNMPVVRHRWRTLSPLTQSPPTTYVAPAW